MEIRTESRIAYSVQPYALATLILGMLLFGQVFAEVSIRKPIMLSASSRAVLAELVKTHPEAKALWSQVKSEAAGILNATPSPIAVINYEGLLDTDSKRIETEKHLVDMDRLALYSWAWCAEPGETYARKIREFILAWAKTYKPTGNPINENKLEPVVIGYYLVKNQFSSTDQQLITAWMQSIAAKERAASIPNNNWASKRIKLVGEIGMTLGDKSHIDYANAKYSSFIASALYSDGSTVDFKERDALRYHCSCLVPLLEYALAAHQSQITISGKNLYEFVSSKNSSVRKSVHFVDPYATGEKTHMEFVNSTVQLDRDRQKAGIPGYSGPFDPAKSAPMYELASAFDEPCGTMAIRVLKSTKTKYATWIMLMAASAYAGANTSPVIETAPSVWPGSSSFGPSRIFDIAGRDRAGAGRMAAQSLVLVSTHDKQQISLINDNRDHHAAGK